MTPWANDLPNPDEFLSGSFRARKICFFGGAPSPPPPPPPPVDNSAAEAERQKSLQSGRTRRGRATTMITGGEGVTEQAPVALKTLLGE